MNLLAELVRTPITATRLGQEFPKAAVMAQTPQDSLYHAEGDVWTHTMLVMDHINTSATPQNGAVLRPSALLHDVAKPQTTQIAFCEEEQRERVRQPNHAAKGRDEAWQLLTDAGIDLPTKREVCDIIAWHQRPGHFLEQHNIENRIARYASLGHAWNNLLTLCRADTRGRISPTTEENLLELDLVEEEIRRVGDLLGHDILHTPFLVSGERTVWLHANLENAILHDPFIDPSRPTFHLFSGLPASGKTTWRTRLDAHVVSLDDLRATHKNFKHGSNLEGTILQEALTLTKQHLAAGRDVVWDATNLTRQRRAKLLSLAHAYNARTHLWSFEDPAPICKARNAERDTIPNAFFDKAAAGREAIGREEAHHITSVIDGKAFPW